MPKHQMPRARALRCFVLLSFLFLAMSEREIDGAELLFPNPMFRVGESPFSVAVGDFNGDGIQDLAVANSGQDNVSILLGLGDGTFSPQIQFAVGDIPVSVSVGDFNGDGVLDLAVANGLSDDISILLGLGDGAFRPATSFKAGESPFAVVGDFNGDGAQDLATANFRSDDVSVLLGRGNGTFVSQSRFPGGDSPYSLALGQFNGDSVEDIVVANLRSDDVSILLGRGDGTFDRQIRFGAGKRPSNVVVRDFNGDGLEDLAVTNNTGPGEVSVLLGRGDGTFAPPIGFEVGWRPLFLTAGDFNSDGLVDLAVVNLGTDDVSVLLGDGDGGFGPQDRFFVGTFPASVTLGDMNGDGKQDLAVVNFFSDDVYVLRGAGDGTFGASPRFGAGKWPAGVAVGDLNGDGVQDLAVANGGVLFGPGAPASDLSILLGIGDGSFGPDSRFELGAGPKTVVLGDFNGDGIQDLAAAVGGAGVCGGGGCHESPGGVSVLLGKGEGAFAPWAHFDVKGTFSVAIGEFNGDGVQDLAVAGLSTEGVSPPGRVSVLLGLNDGTFVAQAEFRVGIVPRSVAVGDFNGDGVEDLAVANESFFRSFEAVDNLDEATACAQAGALQEFALPLLSSRMSVFLLRQPSEEVLEIQDLVNANDTCLPDTGDVSILLGLGDGNFGLETRFGAGKRPSSIVVGDFNGDEVQDLAVANAGTDDVSVMLGLGDGTFTPESRFEVGEFPRAVTVGDFDGDGVQDLAVANESGNSISVLRGLGDGTFARQARFLAAWLPKSLAVGDFNHDGRQDVVVANFESDDVSVLLNQRTLQSTLTVQVRLLSSLALRSHGVIPIVIFSDTNVEATSIDPSTIRLSGASIKTPPKSGNFLCHEMDLNRDGLLDLFCQVSAGELMIDSDEPVVVLQAETFDGIQIRGEARVRIVPE